MERCCPTVVYVVSRMIVEDAEGRHTCCCGGHEMGREIKDRLALQQVSRKQIDRECRCFQAPKLCPTSHKSHSSDQKQQYLNCPARRTSEWFFNASSRSFTLRAHRRQPKQERCENRPRHNSSARAAIAVPPAARAYFRAGGRCTSGCNHTFSSTAVKGKREERCAPNKVASNPSAQAVFI